jgi:archaellum component FlaC
MEAYQLDIALIKKESSATTQTLNRIERRLDKVDDEINAVDRKIDAQFKWILGIMGTVILTFFAAIIQHWLK